MPNFRKDVYDMRLPRWFIVELNERKTVGNYPDYMTAELALMDLEKANPLGCYKITCKWGNI